MYILIQNWREGYNFGNVGQAASMSMLTLFESRYTLKGRYNIGNVGQTASMSMLTLFESRYTLKEGTTLVMLAKLLLWVCLLSLNQDIREQAYSSKPGSPPPPILSMLYFPFKYDLNRSWCCTFSLWVTARSLLFSSEMEPLSLVVGSSGRYGHHTRRW